ncbi:Dye-decolorizing peroxidase msp1 [Leucoagaricus sp. SymC.cos]|nr:Dye-decolorizing peroxidase msp1 [Leucoagaricus sp. SymC.cos]
MSRPTLSPLSGGNNVRLTVPPGWFTTITAVVLTSLKITRKPYNQLATVSFEAQGEQKNHFLANKWNQSNAAMRDIDSSDDMIAVIPQDEALNFDLKFYFSKVSSVHDDTLENAKYASNKFNLLINEKPLNAPKDFPDYTTVIIMVEDSPESEQVAGSPQFDDLICTINCVKGVKGDDSSTGGSVPYNLPNIQGDVLPGLPKAFEYFYYFRIKDLPTFRKVFKEFILAKITTTDELVNRPPPPVNPNKPETFKYPFLGVNVGFSYLGMKLFGLDDSLCDDAYVRGQQQDSKFLGDAGTQRGTFWTPDWDGGFKEVIHGVFIIAAYNEKVATNFIQDLEAKLLVTPNRSCIQKVYILHGYGRPGAEAMNDHFGYRGGLGNPQVAGVTFKDKMRYPGAPLIPGGVIVMGYEGDADKDKRPSWAKDGSFIVTRKMNNLIPEFDDFLLQHGPRIFPTLPPKDAALKLGSRLFGRWKNGTPVELSPDNDDPSIAADDNRINNFVFDSSKNQSRCPFASHIRKANPRNDVSPVESAFKHFIRRHSVPYGPEVTDEERDGRGTIYERGLQLVCYQSSIMRGFKFIQEGWFNDPNFPPNKPVQPGLDPIFGQTGKEDQSVYRSMSGANPNYEQEIMSFPHKFIDHRGGEYFFSPPISTLKNHIAAK